MLTIDPERSLLLVVDFQARLMPAIHDGPRLVANAGKLVAAAKLLDVPIVMTEQNPAGLGPTDEALRALCDEVVPKMGFSAAPQLLPMLEAAAEPAARPRGGNARSLPRHLRQPQPVEPERSTWLLAGLAGPSWAAGLATAAGLPSFFSPSFFSV